MTIKSRVVAVAAAAAVASTGAIVTTAPAAEAKGNPPTITRKEFRKIKKGMSPAQVKRIVGSMGRVESAYWSSGPYSDSIVTRTFKVAKPFNKYSSVSVTFENNPRFNEKPGPMRVTSKYAFWIRN